jgi:hypothetical protein
METHEEAVKRGKTSRKKGAEFELKVRKDLEAKGWLVCKWSNNIELKKLGNSLGDYIIKGNIIPAKRKFNPFNRAFTIGTGFPDFVCITRNLIKVPNPLGEEIEIPLSWEVKFVEAKRTNKLDKEEKEKIEWIKANLKIPVEIAFEEEFKLGKRTKKLIHYREA